MAGTVADVCCDCGKPPAAGHVLRPIVRRNQLTRHMEPLRICSGCLSREPEGTGPISYAPQRVRMRIGQR